MTAPILRISIGKFDADVAGEVERRLRDSRAALEEGIRAMPGLLDYWAGIDRAANAMHNVSFWDSLEHAQQMATFEPMLALGREFAALGVRFERPILNCDTLWRLD